MNFNTLLKWDIATFIGICAVLTAIAIWDPFSLNPEGLNGDTAAQAWYFLPLIPLLILFIYKFNQKK